MVELVIAKYKEDLSWIQELNVAGLRITIYDKGSNETPHIHLPNIGNEAHTYLYHIITRYDTLSDHTAFLQGYPFDHVEKEQLFSMLNNPQQSFEWLTHGMYECDWQALPHHPGLPLAQMYAAATGRISPPFFRFGVGGQFMVHKNKIHNKPVWHYQRSLDIVVHGFPGHPIWCGYERFWDQLFD